MKKLIYLIVLMLVLGLIVSGCSLLGVAPVEKDEATILTKDKPDNEDPEPGTDFKGPHYNLNLIGKKADWSDGESYDNPNRHTIFVPEDTTGYETPNGKPGITIWMTQGNEFAVEDGDAFGDGVARFQLDSGHYDVYVVAKAKPGGDTEITGWAYYKINGGEIYYKVGDVKVGGHSGKPKWKNATNLFYVDGTWVFEWLAGIAGATDTAYFWQYDNHGNKLVQVRFYKR